VVRKVHRRQIADVAKLVSRSQLSASTWVGQAVMPVLFYCAVRVVKS
jgi:hypothetical protein